MTNGGRNRIRFFPPFVNFEVHAVRHLRRSSFPLFAISALRRLRRSRPPSAVRRYRSDRYLATAGHTTSALSAYVECPARGPFMRVAIPLGIDEIHSSTRSIGIVSCSP